jgi:hypothetical protein
MPSSPLSGGNNHLRSWGIGIVGAVVVANGLLIGFDAQHQDCAARGAAITLDFAPLVRSEIR